MDPRIEKILKLPTRQKFALLAIVLVLEGAAIFYGLYQPRMNEYATLQTRLDELQRQIQDNRRIANNLPRYKSEYEQLKKDLDSALTELPNQKEIPSLLTSISSLGKGYVVQPGMQIGSSNGRISRITASGIEVVESYKDEKGRIRKRTIVLSLAKKR